MKKIQFSCNNCGRDLTNQIICLGTLCSKCWDKVKPDIRNIEIK